MSSFLCAGIIFLFFHMSGKIPFFNDFSKMIFRGIVTGSLQIFIILIDLLSYPWDLPKFNEFIIYNISLFVTKKQWILVFVLKIKGGNLQLFFIGAHIEAKKLLKRFPFSQKSEIKLPSASKDGIAGIFLL